jgi:phospholipase C
VRNLPFLSAALKASLVLLVSKFAFADGNLQKVNHIIIVMQENHSFDNYFGALAYAPGTPYHNGNRPCIATDHKCADGLTWRRCVRQWQRIQLGSFRRLAPRLIS